MKLIYFFYLICSIYILYCIYSKEMDPSPAFDVSKLKLSKDIDQIMIVVPESSKSFSAKFYFYVKNEETWEEYIKVDAHIGKNGLGKRIEGDAKTPVGAYIFNKYFGVAENPGIKLPYIQLNEYYYWDCDSDSDMYNQFVDIRNYTDFDKSLSEHLIDEQLAYKYAMNMNYNEEGIPHKGCAIFLHCYTERPYTAGCVAIPEADMLKVIKKVNQKCVIIIDLAENIYKLY